ncbi:MAG: PglZ domain protein [Methanosaeta sp. PtaB.Bin039]|nr:MAG: PglZ domain protein [Methanosaeta sp. PtaB.Bin039]OPY48200.1 MAG: PglZ domain protein [Methanosaeta sp. PtaU1.Bin028]
MGMNTWRDEILKEFPTGIARLTIVVDPDALLFEEGILEAVRERGFELIPFEDHIAFRYAYESKFRTRWDRGEHIDQCAVLHSQTNDLSGVPFDLLQAGRRVSFSLGDIFPNLSYPVVSALDREDLDALYEAQRMNAPGPLGDNATKEFILRHVYKIAPELIKQPSELLLVLLRRHYAGQNIPEVLDERFIQLLHQCAQFDDWPLDALVTDREAFFAFLQERWPIFLDREAAERTPLVGEDNTSYSLAFEGPADLPFDHDDVRVYIDNLFVEGLIHPVSHKHSDILSKTWAGIGIRTYSIEDKSRRLEKLIESLKASIPVEDAKYKDWLHFARGWAELVLLINEQAEGIFRDLIEQARNLQSQVDARFTDWLLNRYSGLANLPPMPPVMLHHVPRFLSRQMDGDRYAKMALIVVDGLSMDQWLVVRNSISSCHSSFRFREQAVFAWIPSLTSVSRQALFAGKAPIFFPSSIQTTDKEASLWRQFWSDYGLKSNEIVFIKGLGDGSLDSVSEAVSHPKTRIAGLVVDKVDRIMHGMELGIAGMHNQVGQWARQPNLSNLFNLLLDNGFQVYLTSDHGNIEAEGCGRPAEGAVADFRGERVRIYSNQALRSRVKEHFPSALEWDPIGLPDDYLALMAPARRAFVQERQHTVSHGGISIEELIVPLVRIERMGQ